MRNRATWLARSRGPTFTEPAPCNAVSCAQYNGRVYRLWFLVALAACGAIFKPKRSSPPDPWALKAAVLHSMMTAPPAFVADRPDCSAAPMPDLQFFCEKKCGEIGELSLKAYCAWECDDVRNPDLGVICKLEVRRNKQDIRADECDAIGQTNLKEHCKQWVASLAAKAR